MLTVTADNLSRLIPCNGSRLLTNFVPVVESDTTVRDEGDAADWIVSQVVGGHFTAEELVERRAPNNVFVTADMVEHLDDYLAMLKATGALVEADMSHSGQGWQVNGRADAISYEPLTQTLTVNDLKFGWSPVEPEMHWPMISHAIGWWLRYGKEFPVQHVKFVIWQPRPYHPEGNVRTWPVSFDKLMELYSFMNATLTNPAETLNTGKWCKGCDRRTACPAFSLAQMNVIDMTTQAFVAELSNDELSHRLDQLTRAEEVIKQSKEAYRDLAFWRIKEGQLIKNYSLTIEKANTSWREGTTPEMLLALTGVDATKKELLTPNQAKKAGISEQVVAAFTERRDKGAKLVRQDVSAKAAKLFNPKGK